ncbi:relaxase/mobilization nuclease domain-containing protein [Nocardia tengchongensis]|uniref:relaxase/mobilization nuclease domain-containing protein n=1 Tax=Nocardia tengchongensis TaxID=2055889 RepID=UPI003606599A
MIPKIKRGQKIGGLMVYLLGLGDHNEHRDRHIIAGSPTVMRAQFLEHFDGPGADVSAASREVALAVAHELDIPRKLYGTQVRMKAKPVAAGVGARDVGLDVVEPAVKGEKAAMRDAPVWHCVLALTPGEELSDDRWSEVVTEFMTRMGFTGTPDGKRAQARWAAVRHGHSGEKGEGQDHIHIAASLVREDGSKVSTFDYGEGKAKGDWKRAQEVAGELEREFGLKVLASRNEGGGLSGNSRAEIERARTRTGETERERLRRMVRATATASESEAEFVQGLREAGISVLPYPRNPNATTVTGYSVRLRHGDSEVGPWLGGGKLAGDLSLSALREQQWDDNPEARDAAVAVWKNRGTKQAGRARAEGVDGWQQAATAAEQWRERLAEIPSGDRAQWAWMAGQAAGVFAAWSEALEGDQPGAFAAAATELTRSAQLHRRTDRYQPPQGTHPSLFEDVAQLLLTQQGGARPRSHMPGSPSKADDAVVVMAAVLLALMLLLLLLAIAVVFEVARAHRSRGELARAMAVENTVREHLDPVRASWETELQDRRDQWDRDAADVFTAAAGRAAQRVIEREPQPEPDTRSGASERLAKEREENLEWAEQVLASTSGPIMPLPPQAASQTRRAYYTELSEDERNQRRVWAISSAQFASRDPQPRGWTDELLVAEHAHRRTEVELLAADIAERRTGRGPHTRQVLADNAALAQQAEKIVPALQAQAAADAVLADKQQLARQKQRLERQLEETPRRRVVTRGKLATQLAETEAALADIAPELTAADAAAKAAAKATGVPVREWDTTLREATEQRQQWRLREARDKDQRDIDADTTYLSKLQRDLDGVESEHARRVKLTPEQRASEARIRTQGKAQQNPGKKRTPPTPGRAAGMPPPPPHLRRGSDRGRGHGM